MDNNGKMKKKTISRIILFWLLIIVVIIFLMISLGAFLLLAANSKQSILETVKSFTEYDIEAYKGQPAERWDELMQSVSDVAVLFLDGGETTNVHEEVNDLLREWSSTEFMSELSLVDRDGMIVSSSNPDLIGYNLWQDGRFEALPALFDQEDDTTSVFEGTPLSDTPVQTYTAKKMKDQDSIILVVNDRYETLNDKSIQCIKNIIQTGAFFGRLQMRMIRLFIPYNLSGVSPPL